MQKRTFFRIRYDVTAIIDQDFIHTKKRRWVGGGVKETREQLVVSCFVPRNKPKMYRFLENRHTGGH